MSRRHSHNEAVRQYRASLACQGGLLERIGVNPWRVLAGVATGVVILAVGAGAWFSLVEALA